MTRRGAAEVIPALAAAARERWCRPRFQLRVLLARRRPGRAGDWRRGARSPARSRDAGDRGGGAGSVHRRQPRQPRACSTRRRAAWLSWLPSMNATRTLPSHLASRSPGRVGTHGASPQLVRVVMAREPEAEIPGLHHRRGAPDLGGPRLVAVHQSPANNTRIPSVPQRRDPRPCDFRQWCGSTPDNRRSRSQWG